MTLITVSEMRNILIRERILDENSVSYQINPENEIAEGETVGTLAFMKMITQKIMIPNLWKEFLLKSMRISILNRMILEKPLINIMEIKF